MIMQRLNKYDKTMHKQRLPLLYNKPFSRSMQLNLYGNITFFNKGLGWKLYLLLHNVHILI